MSTCRLPRATRAGVPRRTAASHAAVTRLPIAPRRRCDGMVAPPPRYTPSGANWARPDATGRPRSNARSLAVCPPARSASNVSRARRSSSSASWAENENASLATMIAATCSSNVLTRRTSNPDGRTPDCSVRRGSMTAPPTRLPGPAPRAAARRRRGSPRARTTMRRHGVRGIASGTGGRSARSEPPGRRT
jgi:hypothetical protein